MYQNFEANESNGSNRTSTRQPNQHGQSVPYSYQQQSMTPPTSQQKNHNSRGVCQSLSSSNSVQLQPHQHNNTPFRQQYEVQSPALANENLYNQYSTPTSSSYVQQKDVGYEQPMYGYNAFYARSPDLKKSNDFNYRQPFQSKVPGKTTPSSSKSFLSYSDVYSSHKRQSAASRSRGNRDSFAVNRQNGSEASGRSYGNENGYRSFVDNRQNVDQGPELSYGYQGSFVDNRQNVDQGPELSYGYQGSFVDNRQNANQGPELSYGYQGSFFDNRQNVANQPRERFQRNLMFNGNRSNFSQAPKRSYPNQRSFSDNRPNVASQFQQRSYGNVLPSSRSTFFSRQTGESRAPINSNVWPSRRSNFLRREQRDSFNPPRPRLNKQSRTLAKLFVKSNESSETMKENAEPKSTEIALKPDESLSNGHEEQKKPEQGTQANELENVDGIELD